MTIKRRKKNITLFHNILFKTSFIILDTLNYQFDSERKIKIFTVKNRTVSNIGDNINRTLLSKITGNDYAEATYIEKSFCPTIFFIGSILAFATKHSVILGSGFNSESDVKKITDFPKVIFLRGFQSAKLLADRFKMDVEDINVFGDPALLVSDYFPRSSIIKEKILFILNHSDLLTEDQRNWCKRNDIEVFSMNVKIEFSSFFIFLTSFSLVISTALHGIIFCDSFNIKCIPARLQDSIVSEFKFYDYFSISSNRMNYKIIPAEHIFALSSMNQLDDFILPGFLELNEKKLKLTEIILANV